MKKAKILLGAGLCIVFLAGCGTKQTDLVQIQPEGYQKRIHTTTEAIKGNLSWDYTFTLQAEGYKRVYYDVTNSNLQLEKVYVSTGDKVKKGDLLISFCCESLEETIAGYEEEIDSMNMMIDHYQNLMKIDSSLDYKEDIKMLKDDIYITSLYLEEAEEKIESYQVKAQDSGTITAINDYLLNGYFSPGRNLITQICGTGNYTAEVDGIEDTGCFTVGETYVATLSNIEYELELTSIQGKELLFTPISDMSSVSDGDKLTMKIQMPLLENVVYVKKSAVKKINENYVVYVEDEEGFLEARVVTVGQTAGDYMIITQGLDGGEKVALN